MVRRLHYPNGQLLPPGGPCEGVFKAFCLGLKFAGFPTRLSYGLNIGPRYAPFTH